MILETSNKHNIGATKLEAIILVSLRKKKKVWGS
jgi:hypothetical protein